MQFTIATLLAAISAVSAAPAALPSDAPASELKFGIMAIRSASPIHYGQVNASGQKFFIGVEPSAYCPVPPVPAGACPSGKYTSMVGDSSLSLNVMVPGGQRIYIDADGSLSYTQAHSAFMPPGAVTDGFTIGPVQENTLRHISHSKGGFYACPAKKDQAPWKIFVGQPTDAAAPSGSASDCLPFSATAVEFKTEQFGAWQY
ncbi:hypothetical protein Dda_3697 [Drechslerella dactyloides]|uniref:IgE-binding protein n=1 Tax=Drechslerella dactyloides TaxID=74499 RepID=A0AAD6IZ87_DREDA|nr:hypothetical protein Dda_3697 [Drechslerella dactyloides]